MMAIKKVKSVTLTDPRRRRHAMPGHAGPLGEAPASISRQREG